MTGFQTSGESGFMLNASVVMTTFNRKEVVDKAVKAVLKQKFPARFELVVVDGGSTDGTVELLEKLKGRKNLAIINDGKRLSACAGRNKAISLAKNEVIVVMDDDCIPEKEWLTKLVAPFDDSKIGMTSSFSLWGGTSTAFRKKFLEGIGGFDEDYGYYREDTDLVLKCLEQGFERIMVNARFHHDHKLENPKGGFIGLIKHGLKRTRYHRNDPLFFKKHPNKLAKQFLHVKFGFIVDPLEDFKAATGTWWDSKRKPQLSSPQGLVFLENKSILHEAAIIILATAYVIAVKSQRLFGSVKAGKLLL